MGGALLPYRVTVGMVNFKYAALIVQLGFNRNKMIEIRLCRRVSFQLYFYKADLTGNSCGQNGINIYPLYLAGAILVSDLEGDHDKIIYGSIIPCFICLIVV